jgi:NADH-quinone oxidoreductase subunit H
MIFMAVLAVVLFFGGWHSPFEGIAYLEAGFSWVPGIIWLLAKSTFFMFLYLWIRATFPLQQQKSKQSSMAEIPSKRGA